MTSSADHGESDTVETLKKLTETSDTNPSRRGVVRPDQTDLSSIKRDPREKRAPGQDHFNNPEDYDFDPELTERQN